MSKVNETKEVSKEMLKEFTKAMSDMMDKIINIADKYGEDRNRAIEKCARTFMMAATFGDYSEYYEMEGDNKNE